MTEQLKIEKKPVDPINFIVGKRLRYKREHASFSQSVLGSMVGVSRIKIGQYEAGTSAIPAAMLYKFSRIFKTAVGYFYEDIAEPMEIDPNGSDPLSSREIMTMLKDYESLKNQKVRTEIANLIKDTAAFYRNDH